jgi:hypothetical protein
MRTEQGPSQRPVVCPWQPRARIGSPLAPRSPIARRGGPTDAPSAEALAAARSAAAAAARARARPGRRCAGTRPASPPWGSRGT